MLDAEYGDAVPYCVHSIIETPGYLADAKNEHMTPEEREAAVDLIAANPKAGDLIVGSGGCRKVRIGGKGKGKSGGYRVITFFSGEDVPVFLLAVLAKGSRANFSAGERNAMKQATMRLRESLGAGAESRTKGRPR
jgi:hypothetical protein